MPIVDCKLGKDVKIPHPDLVNLYGCELGDRVFVGPFVEIQKGVTAGADCRIQSHSFLCEGVHLGERVFVSHGVIFINDKYPRVNNPDWKPVETLVFNDTSIGSGAVILCGVHLGAHCFVGCGAVVTRDVPADGVIRGEPARLRGGQS